MTEPRPDFAALESEVGHPGERWQALRDKVKEPGLVLAGGTWLVVLLALGFLFRCSRLLEDKGVTRLIVAREVVWRGLPT